jgi:hypothetical protein
MKTLKNILLQFIPVALGVFIGVWASNWNEDRKHKKTQQLVIENIVKELESNKRKIQFSIQAHENLRASLDTIDQAFSIKDRDKSIFGLGGFTVVPGWTGVKIASLSNSIYESGLISNAFSDVPFDLIHRINSIYNYQESYNEMTKPMLNRMIQSNKNTTVFDAISMMEFFSSDILSMEKNIDKGYDQVLEYLNKEYLKLK